MFLNKKKGLKVFMSILIWSKRYLYSSCFDYT